MNLLLKQVKVVDPNSKYNGKKVDILIEKGVVKKIAKTINKSAKTQVWTKKNAHISPGWLDIGTQIGEPGYEQRETIDTVTSAAIAGGYTGIAPFPNTQPILQSKSDLLALQAKTAGLPIDFYPIAALSKNIEGQEITEFIDLTEAGAIAFSDGARYTQNAGLLQRGLEYARSVDGLIINQANNYDATNDAYIHEGEVSVRLGLKGLPSYSESSAIKRDIELATYSESNLLIHNVSTAASIPTLKQAAKTKSIFSSVSYLNLICNDSHVDNFDSSYKVLPPLRSKTDQSALIKAVKAGTIQIITSNHTPVEVESKHLEFERSAPGATGLETCYAALQTYASEYLDQEDIVMALAIQSRSILGLYIPVIDVDEEANFTLFDPELRWTYSEDHIQSKSKNNPFINQELQGKALGIVHHEVLVDLGE